MHPNSLTYLTEIWNGRSLGWWCKCKKKFWEIGHAPLSEFEMPVLSLKYTRIAYLPGPIKYKSSMCISVYIGTTFFYLRIFLKKLADDQGSSETKGSIYHTKLVLQIQQYFHDLYSIFSYHWKLSNKIIILLAVLCIKHVISLALM